MFYSSNSSPISNNGGANSSDNYLVPPRRAGSFRMYVSKIMISVRICNKDISKLQGSSELFAIHKKCVDFFNFIECGNYCVSFNFYLYYECT